MTPHTSPSAEAICRPRDLRWASADFEVKSAEMAAQAPLGMLGSPALEAHCLA